MKFRYFTVDYAIRVHDEIVRESGGLLGIKDIGLLESSLSHLKNDDYYPSLEEKLTHLIFSINKTPSLENGKIAQAYNLNNSPGFGSTEYFVFRGIKDKTNTDFIYYLSKTDWFIQNAVNSMVGASGRQRADKGFVQNAKVLLPSLSTQTKIANILSAYDDLIENNNRRIKILEEMAQQTYEEWFVRMRFPGYENLSPQEIESLKNGEEEGFPEGWEKVRLRKYINFRKGKKLDEIHENQIEGTEKILLLDSLESGNYQYTYPKNHRIVKRGDILMLMDGARSSYVFLANDGIIGSTMAKVETSKIPSSLLFYYFQYNLEWLQINNTGAAIPHANPKFINSIMFKLSSKEVLRESLKTLFFSTIYILTRF